MQPWPERPAIPSTCESVIFLYMECGPSQIDTFDRSRCSRSTMERTRATSSKLRRHNSITTDSPGSPWKFQPYGESGIPVSDLFPHIAKHVDSMAIVRSMTSQFPEHTFANYFLHTVAVSKDAPVWALGLPMDSVAKRQPSWLRLC